MIQGERRAEFMPRVGAFKGKVVAINPTKEQIEELYELQTPLEKEPEYCSSKDTDVPDHLDTDGNVVKVTKTIRSVRIDFHIRDVDTNKINKKSYFLQDRPFVKKDLSKQQYINVLGKSAWSDTPGNLPAKFTSYLDNNGNPTGDISYHEAVIGEAALVGFLDTWLAIDKKKVYVLEVNTADLFDGKFAELQSMVNSELTSQIMGIYCVRAVDGESGTQFYQDMWDEFLPGFCLKFFQMNTFTPERIAEIQEKAKSLADKIRAKQSIGQNEWMANWEKFVNDITDPEYGCKHTFTLEPAKDFDPNTHYATAAASIDSSGSEY